MNVLTPLSPANFPESRRKTWWQSIHKFVQAIFVEVLNRCLALGFHLKSHFVVKERRKTEREREWTNLWMDPGHSMLDMARGKAQKHQKKEHMHRLILISKGDRKLLHNRQKSNKLTAVPLSRWYRSQRWFQAIPFCGNEKKWIAKEHKKKRTQPNISEELSISNQTIDRTINDPTIEEADTMSYFWRNHSFLQHRFEQLYRIGPGCVVMHVRVVFCVAGLT